MAGSLTVALFSLAGLPFFAGFTTKFYLFTAVAAGGYLWLAGLAATASLISLYYYLMVIKADVHPPRGRSYSAADAAPDEGRAGRPRARSHLHRRLPRTPLDRLRSTLRAAR